MHVFYGQADRGGCPNTLWSGFMIFKGYIRPKILIINHLNKDVKLKWALSALHGSVLPSAN